MDEQTTATATAEDVPEQAAEAEQAAEPERNGAGAAEPEEGRDDALKEFAALEMDDEAQARALADMGLTGDARDGAEEESGGDGTKPAPAWYSPEELGNTPLDAIDDARLPEGAREYLPVVKRNMDMARQTIAELQRQNAMLMERLQNAGAGQAAPQSQGQAAARPDFKSLAEQAAKIAKERLGLGEDDDLDMTYEPEHAAAFHMAMREIADGQRAAETRTLNEQNEWSGYVRQLMAKPDFAARDKWVTEKLTAAGKDPGMLADYIRGTGDYRGAMRVMEAWNRMYDAEQARAGAAVKNQARPAKRPPALESASGADAGGRKSLDLKAFGEMEKNPEAQAKALIQLGIV